MMRHSLRRSIPFSLSTSLLWVCLFSGAARAQSVPERLIQYPQWILYNGKIVTMSDTSYSSDVGQVVQALAIRGNQILALGNNEEILGLAGPNTQKIDLKGRTVTPGIVNAHTHIHDAALNRWTTQWRGDASEKPIAAFNVQGTTPEEIRRNIEIILRERTQKLRPKQWIFLNLPTKDFIGTYFLQDRKITQSELDQIMTDHPVILNAHPAYVWNSTAVKRLNEMYDAPPLPEEVDETVFGSRIIEYRRMALVDDYFQDRIDMLANILEEDLLLEAAAGITTFSSHITGARYFDAYMKLVREHKMPLRFAYTHYMGGLSNPGLEVFAARMGDMAGLGDDYFWQSGVSASAIDSGPPMICTSIDAQNDVKKREWCRLDPGRRYTDFLYNGLKNRVRIVVGHNYGDKSADQYMDMLDRLVQEEGFSLDYIRSRRLTMDHCGLYPRPDQLPRMKKFGILLSCGSNVLTRSYPWLQKYGMEYADWLAPVKSALDAGVKVVFESEGAIENGLFSAFTPFVTRKNAQGNIVSAQNAVDRNIVMKMATSWSAEFVLREDKVGTLEEGKWADLIVLNKDYFTVPVEEISQVYPILTMVGGKIIYVRSDAAPDLGLQPVGGQLRYRWETGQRPPRMEDM